MRFLLRTKGSHQSPSFDTFKCSRENLLNSSCHFPNHRSVFLQNFYHSSVSFKILLCTYLGQTLYTLNKRNQSKWKFLEFEVLGSKQISFLLHFATLSSVIRRKSSILFQLKFYILSTK